MSLQPHQERVVAERDQLNTCIASLGNFINSDTFTQVDRAERNRLIRQEAIMKDLAQVLTERIEAFVVTPTNDFALGKACDLSGEGGCDACQ